MSFLFFRKLASMHREALPAIESFVAMRTRPCSVVFVLLVLYPVYLLVELIAAIGGVWTPADASV